jgi:hypothetical protein
MATIRIFATVCAALFAGLTLTLESAELTPAAAQSATEAQPGAPLNLLPRIAKTKKFSRQARTPTRVAKAKTFTKRRTVAKVEPVAKPSTFKRTAHRRAAPTHSFARRAAPSRAFARRQNHSVVARNDDDAVTQSHTALGFQAETQPIRSASPWLDSPLGATDPATSYALASGEAQSGGARSADSEKTKTAPETITDDRVQVADADEINEIDLAASQAPAVDVAASQAPAPNDKSWLNALLAVLGGAFAAASAARFLLA